jgi:hypothetical protein
MEQIGAIVARAGVVTICSQLVVEADIANQLADPLGITQVADIDTDHRELYVVGTLGQDLDRHKAAIRDAAHTAKREEGVLDIPAKLHIGQRLSHLLASWRWCSVVYRA